MKRAIKLDRRLVYYTRALRSLIDWHLKIWAGCVGLGKEVDGPSDVVAGLAFAEVADWWLLTQYSGDDAYRQQLSETVRSQIERHHNRYPELQPRLLKGVVQALTSPAHLRLMATIRYEAIERIVARWDPGPGKRRRKLWPFDKLVVAIWRRLSKQEQGVLKDCFLGWTLEAVEELKIAEPHDWRLDGQWQANSLYDDLSIVNAMQALRQDVLKKFESAILEYSPSRADAKAQQRLLDDARARDEEQEIGDLGDTVDLDGPTRAQMELLSQRNDLENTAAPPVDLTDETADAPQDRDMLAILDSGVLERELTPRQGQVLGELRHQILEECLPKFNAKQAGKRLGMSPATVRSHHRDLTARAARLARRESQNG
jgi:hypothetical protein